MTVDLTSALNEAQREAVTAQNIPLCILAGAGTGKTRVITYRIAHLILECGAYADSILAVTFTNKAAEEMRHRVEQLCPASSRRLWLGTFHSLAARVLRRYGAGIGIAANFLIYDQDDSERLMKSVLTEEGGVVKEHLGGVQALISGWRNQGFFAADVGTSVDRFHMLAKRVYHRYEQRLKDAGALDFDCLLLWFRAFLQNAEASAPFTRYIKHVLVDEFQDTNVVQADIVQLVAKNAQSVAVVGDDDQSIYGWRGALPHNMRRFLESMPGASLIKLEENYRSTQSILNAANHVIAKNMGRLEKNLVATVKGGLPIRIMRAFNDTEEARLVIDAVLTEQRRGTPLSSMAVLMRTSAQSRPFEDALRRYALPYRVVGGMRFYDRKEIKDVLALVRAALHPESDIDVLRALAAVPRGVGDTSVKRALDVARMQGMNVLGVFASPDMLEAAGVTKRSALHMVSFAQMLIDLKKQLESLPADEAMAFAVEKSGIVEYLSDDKDFQAESRIENIGELLSAVKTFVEEARSKEQPDSMAAFLEAASLLASTEDVGAGGGDAAGRAALSSLPLMTLHAAKGLEFDVVFMVGMEEFGFPHARALEEDGDPGELEEERRLAYVGITRARKKLFMSYALRRMTHGTVKPRTPSRFLRELPRDAVDGDVSELWAKAHAETRPASAWRTGSSWSSSWQSAKPTSAASAGPKKAVSVHTKSGGHYELDPEFGGNASAKEFSVGSTVWHKAFGRGRVMSVQGSGSFERAQVVFDHDGATRVIVVRHLQPA
jgi:DNA helicase-2/ATP-dependent DNA helicase PcrA